jgi:ribosomal protein S27E
MYDQAMSNYQCPKCGGTEYFMSQRNVMKGIGGLWGNTGGLKAFPVCRVCDEIMALPKGRSKLLKVVLIVLGIYVGIIIIFVVGAN